MDNCSYAHTPGPWQVLVTKHPHLLGGHHTERRVFTGYNHPQMKGPVGVVNGSTGIPAIEGGAPYHMVAMSEADAHLIAAAPVMFDALRRLIEAADSMAWSENCGTADEAIAAANLALDTARGLAGLPVQTVVVPFPAPTDAA